MRFELSIGTDDAEVVYILTDYCITNMIGFEFVTDTNCHYKYSLWIKLNSVEEFNLFSDFVTQNINEEEE